MIRYVSNLTADWVARRIPKRPENANKGTFGKVLVIAGSASYPGAAYLSCAAAYRVGAGLVTLASIKPVCDFVIKKLPEVTLIPFPEKDGAISEQSVNQLTEPSWAGLTNFSEEDVVLFGPGLTTKDSVIEFTEKLLKRYDLPRFVIDGDGLNVLSKIKNWWQELEDYGIYMVLTPHPGEMSRLTGLSIKKIQSKRQEVAEEYASRVWGKTVVLKGSETIIASPVGEVKVSPFVNPLLSTAGTGDVLSGIIAGLWTQGLDTNYGFDAACSGVYIHGLAGQMLKEKLGDRGMLASEMLPVLPQAIKKLKMSIDK